MIAKRRTKRGLGFIETFEDRTLLAGNLTVTFVGGVLTITGDSAANSANLVQDGNGTTAPIALTGLDGTTINGDLGDPFNFTGPVTEVHVNLGAGNDTFVVMNLVVGASMEVNGQDGNDFLAVKQMASGGVIDLRGDAGNDILFAGLCAITTMRVFGGVGNDVIVSDANAINDLTLGFGVGNDNAAIGVTAVGNLTVNTSPGKDKLMISKVGATNVNINTVSPTAPLPRGFVKGSNGTTIVLNDSNITNLQSDPVIPDPDAPVTVKNVKKIYKKAFKDQRTKDLATSVVQTIEFWYQSEG